MIQVRLFWWEKAVEPAVKESNNNWFEKLLTMFQNIELEISDWLEDPKKTSSWLLDQQELMGDTETPPYADLLGGGEEVGSILRDE